MTATDRDKILRFFLHLKNYRDEFLTDWVLPEDYCKEDLCNFPWDGKMARN